jgi:hypothetical protein
MGAMTYLYFLPWAVFLVSDRVGGPGVTWAAVAAMATSFLVLGAVRRQRLHPATGISLIALFSAVVVSSLFVPDSATFNDYWRGIVTGTYALVAGLSLRRWPVSRTPLMAEVSPSLWPTRAFDRLVRSVVFHWVIGLLVLAAIFAAGAEAGDATLRTLSNWFAPIVVAIAAMALDGRRWREFTDWQSVGAEGDGVGDASSFTMQLTTSRAAAPGPDGAGQPGAVLPLDRR